MDYDGFVRVVLTLNPPGYPEYALFMQTSRSCEEVGRWGQVLGLSRALSRTVSTVPGAESDYARWDAGADLDTPGADAAVTIRALPAVVEAAYPEVGWEAVVRFAPLDDFRAIDVNEVLFARIWRNPPGEQDKLPLFDHTMVRNGGS